MAANECGNVCRKWDVESKTLFSVATSFNKSLASGSLFISKKNYQMDEKICTKLNYLVMVFLMVLFFCYLVDGYIFGTRKHTCLQIAIVGHTKKYNLL